jgi:hypothetical protein
MENNEVGSKEYNSLQDQACKLLADKVAHSSWGDKVRAWRYLSMLSSLRTSIKNIGGNISMGVISNTKENVMYLMQQAYNATPAGKAHPINETALLNSKTDAADISAAYRDTESGSVNPDLTEGGSKYNLTRGIENNKTIFNWTPLENLRNMYSNLYGAQDEYGAGGALIAFSSLEGKNKLSAALKAAGDKTETAIKDLSDKGVVGYGGLKNQFARVAVRTAKAQGYSYASLLETESRVKDGIAEATKNGTQYELSDSDASALSALAKSRERGISEAKEATFHDINAISDAVIKLGQIPGFGPSIMPFAKTPGNILARGIEYSPAGFLYALKDSHTAQGAGKVLNDVAKATTGTTLLSLGMLAAAMGIVNASGSGDDRKDYYDQNIRGKQSYSVNLPGGGTYTLDWTVPASLPFFVGVELQNSLGGNGNLTDSLLSISEPMLENTMLSGLNDTLNTARYSEGGNALASLGVSALSNFDGQFVPTALKQTGRALEINRSSNYSGDAGSLDRILDKSLNRSTNWIPSLQDEIYYDQWGRPVENIGDNFLSRLAYNKLSPGYYSSNRSTPVDDELSSLSDALDDSAVLPQSATTSASVKIDGKNHRMTESEMQQYAQERGQTSYELIDELISTKSYSDMTDQERSDYISQLYKFANAEAHKKVFGDSVNVYSGYDKQASVYSQNGAEGLIDYLEYKDEADTNGNGSLTQDEAQAYLDELDIPQSQKSFFWQQTNAAWKTNPYS